MLRIARIAMLLGTARALLVSPSPRPVLAASWPRQRLTMAVPSDLKFPWQSGTYSDEQVEELWDTVASLYESESAAADAARQCKYVILCPLYASPQLLRASHTALIQNIGEEDAAEILVKNPAVLTCGEGLRNADRAEIFRLANLRQVLDRIPPQAIWATILVLVVGIGGKILAIQLGLVDRVDWGGSVPLGF